MEKLQRDFNLFRKSMGIGADTIHSYTNHLNKKYQTMGYINPSIIEERKMNMTSMDVFSRLLMDRIIFLGTAIDDTVANIINGQLLFLQSIDNTKPIELYINSPGGHVYSGLGIYDTMSFIEPNVNTTVMGLAASMGFVIAVSGDHRSSLKHSRLMQHQPLGGVSGQASDIEITANQIKTLKKELYLIISEKTNQSYEKVEKDCDRDYWMTSKEALEYGAIDKII